MYRRRASTWAVSAASARALWWSVTVSPLARRGGEHAGEVVEAVAERRLVGDVEDQ
jgi:hypothetical protein